MMTLGNTARVLALAQTFDNRKVDQLVVGSWHEVLGDVDFDDACQAVRDHYARTRDWIMPADILSGVSRIRRDRLERAPYAVPAADPDNVPAYLADLRQGIHRAAGDRHLDQAAIAGTFPAVPPAHDHQAERAARAQARHAIAALPAGRRQPDLTYAEAVADLDEHLAAHQPATSSEPVT